MLNKKNPRFLVSAQVEAGCVFEKVCVRGSAQHAGQWSIWFLWRMWIRLGPSHSQDLSVYTKAQLCQLPLDTCSAKGLKQDE